MKKVFALLVFAGLCAAVFLSSPTASSQGRKDKLRKNANKIENNYIVVLDDSWVGERGRFSIAPYVARKWPRPTGASSNTSSSTRSMVSQSR